MSKFSEFINWAWEKIVAKKPKPDTTKPSVPTGVTATVLDHKSIRIDWNRSTDNVAVDGYYINRNGARKGTVQETITSFLDTGLLPSTTYTYQVIAYDQRGNIAASASKAATTQALPLPPVDPPPVDPPPVDPPPVDPPPVDPPPVDPPPTGTNFLLGDGANNLTTDTSEKLTAS